MVVEVSSRLSCGVGCGDVEGSGSEVCGGGISAGL